MEYRLPYDTKPIGNYANECQNGWLNSYDIWSADGSNPSNSSFDSCSPATASLSSSFSIINTSDARNTNTRRSSTVSPTVSTWSDGIATLPVTPPGNGQWYPLTPIRTAPRLSSSPYINSDYVYEAHQKEEENLWTSRSWPQQQMAMVYQTQLPQYFPDSEMNENQHILPFTQYNGDPALSRQIFSDPTWTPSYQQTQHCHLDWTGVAVWSKPRTVAPEATVRSLIARSPSSDAEYSTPLQGNIFEQPETCINSSPTRVLSPPIVPSQNGNDPLRRHLEATVNAPQPTLIRRTSNRNIRRQSSRKALLSATERRRNSGTTVHKPLVPQSTFACSIPGCIDKNTGLPKRFRRQEHRKRHENTVHDATKEFYCWVPGCRRAFTRADNRASHVHKTHGRNTPAQRNKYVATLDKSNRFYDPAWRGDITEDGYPLIEDVAVHRCWAADCSQVFHLEEKLVNHMLASHGIKSSCAKASYDSFPDENTDLFEPKREAEESKWEGVVKKETSPGVQ